MALNYPAIAQVHIQTGINTDGYNSPIRFPYNRFAENMFNVTDSK